MRLSYAWYRHPSAARALLGIIHAVLLPLFGYPFHNNGSCRLDSWGTDGEYVLHGRNSDSASFWYPYARSKKYRNWDRVKHSRNRDTSRRMNNLCGSTTRRFVLYVPNDPRFFPEAVLKKFDIAFVQTQSAYLRHRSLAVGRWLLPVGSSATADRHFFVPGPVIPVKALHCLAQPGNGDKTRAK